MFINDFDPVAFSANDLQPLSLLDFGLHGIGDGRSASDIELVDFNRHGV